MRTLSRKLLDESKRRNERGFRDTVNTSWLSIAMGVAKQPARLRQMVNWLPTACSNNLQAEMEEQ